MSQTSNKGDASVKYIIRPYYGHDCDSTSGFNNGHYLDEIEIDARDEGDAIERAIEIFLSENTSAGNMSRDSYMGGDHLYLEYAYSDSDGSDITRERYIELNESGDDVGGYLYQYISFAEVTLLDEVSDE